jgi:hypothetical protein
MTSRTEAEGTSTWNWGTSAANQNIGQLVSMSAPGYSESYTYGNSGRPMTTTYSADSSYTITWNYWLGENALRDVTFPALPGLPALHLIMWFGGAEQALTTVCNYDNLSQCYYLLGAQDAWGHPTQESSSTEFR